MPEVSYNSAASGRADFVEAHPTHTHDRWITGQPWSSADIVVGRGATVLPTDPDKLVETAAQYWREQTAGLSSITAKVRNPHYVFIILLGRRALPGILRELQRDGSHWFPALKRISGADPVPAHSRGNVQEMQREWLEWGQREGLL